MPKRCPNLADDATREVFNGLLRRLGGRPLGRSDVAGRQGYLGRLTPTETGAYAKAHAVWDRHASPEAAQAFLDSLDRLKAAVAGPAGAAPAPEGPPPVAGPAAAVSAAVPLRRIDASAGTVPEAERAITRAPVGTWVAVGDQLWKRTDADPVRPWQGSDGGSLSTAGLLDLARAARGAVERPPAQRSGTPEMAMNAPGATLGFQPGPNRGAIDELTEPDPEAAALVQSRSRGGVLDDLLKVFAPGARGPAARTTLAYQRQWLGELARQYEVAREATKQAARIFQRMRPADREGPNGAFLNYTDAVESGHLKRITDPVLRTAAEFFRQRNAERQEALRARGMLSRFIEHYMGHLWEDPRGATPDQIGARYFGHRPLAGPESYKKRRTIPTWRDGVERGLVPTKAIDWNPIVAELLKGYEIDKSIGAHDYIENLQANGIYRMFRSARQAPLGWRPLQDKAARLFAPPEIRVKEAYDERLVGGLMDLAEALGVDVERRLRIGGKRWGYTSEGGPVVTRAFGPETVLLHELGHQVDLQYGLAEQLTRRGETAQELRALADLRFEGKQSDETPQVFRDYVRQGSEKIANLVHAYVMLPARARQVAPQSVAALERLIDEHPELQELGRIRPSLVLGERQVTIPLPGFIQVGQGYLPDEAAQVIENYLMPGLHGRPLYDALHGFASTMTMANLGLSAFHAALESAEVQVTGMGLAIQEGPLRHPLKAISHLGPVAGALTGGTVGFAIMPGPFGYAAGAMIGGLAAALRRGGRLRHGYLVPGSRGEAIEDIVRNFARAGGRGGTRDLMLARGPGSSIGMSHGAAAMGALRGPLRLEQFGQLLHHGFPAAMQAASWPIMGWLVPRIKFAATADLMAMELRQLRQRNPNPSEAEVLRVLDRALDNVEDRMGQLTYDNLAWDRVAKDIAQLLIFAPSFNFGTWRWIGGAMLADTPQMVKRLAAGERTPLTARQASLLGLLVVTMLNAALFQYLATGQWPWQTDTPLKDLIWPRNDPEGERRTSFVNYMTKEVGPLALETERKGLPGFAHHVETMVQNKLAGAWRHTWEFLQNRDYFGAEIYDPEELGPEPFGSLEWLEAGIRHIVVDGYQPIFLQQLRRGLEEKAPLGEALGSLVGAPPAPKAVVRSDEEQAALEQRVARPAATRRAKRENAPGILDLLEEATSTKP